MKKVVVRVLAIIGAINLLTLLLFVIVVLRMGPSRHVPGKTVLELRLDAMPIEQRPEDLFAEVFLSDQPVIRDIVEALERAGDDERVVGLVADIGTPAIGIAHVQEIRDAIARFRAKKKFALAFSETFGEFGPGTGTYYLATAFEEIWLQPSGDLGLTGLLADVPFLRGTLDKLGVQPRFDQRKEYKTALNSLTERKFTPAHRESMKQLIESLFGQIVAGIAKGRSLKEQEVRALVDRGPLSAKEALDARLVDKLAYADHLRAEAKKRGGGAQILPLGKYFSRVRRPDDDDEKTPTIALVYGVGPVERGKSEFDPTSSDVSMGSDTVTAGFRAAIEDKNVKAILFRVDSPGGSYVASDTIWRETVRAKEAGKPVIVSMSNLAGSGGYFVAMHADKIVAHPGTLTGSIGVFGGKFVTEGLWSKIGLTFDEVHEGANAAIWSQRIDYSPAGWARVQGALDRIYADFTTKVAEGRRLSKEQVLEIAKGRVWTGEDAKKHGLVDELGGYAVALQLAKRAAKIGDADKIQLHIYPKPKNAAKELLRRVLGKDSDEGDEGASNSGTHVAIGERLRERLHRAGEIIRMLEGEPESVIRMTPIRISP
jgi:protease-4